MASEPDQPIQEVKSSAGLPEQAPARRKPVEQEQGFQGKPGGQKKSIASRGIPSKDSLYLPPFNSPSMRPFEDGSGAITHTFWDLSEVLNFVFPRHYQLKYNEIAEKFLLQLIKSLTLDGPALGNFVKANGISKATFYNRVLPRLKRIGIIKVERDTLVALESKRKFRPMKIHLSKTFGNYLNKIGNSWHAIVDTAREKAQVKEEG
ncbi:hypothetical protein FJZ26_04955 [Candidatus Parvarchaeota archaeon]|nr:hypothetical protein [Candidatus Parvarchaeota archaeon]